MKRMLHLLLAAAAGAAILVVASVAVPVDALGDAAWGDIGRGS